FSHQGRLQCHRQPLRRPATLRREPVLKRPHRLRDLTSPAIFSCHLLQLPVSLVCRPNGQPHHRTLRHLQRVVVGRMPWTRLNSSSCNSSKPRLQRRR
ncbi:hypothetical protein FOZ63_007376, partial [Perkinsus olseni]